MLAKLCALSLFTISFLPGISAQVPIHSQTLTQDTSLGSPTQSCQFDNDAKILTNGFLLAIKCKTISSTKALIVAFEGRGSDGASGPAGQGVGGNGGDGQDGTYGKRGSKVSIQAGQFLG